MTKKSIITSALLILFAISLSLGQGTAQFFTKADTFFKTYVKEGRVAYAEIKSNPDALNELLKMAENISVSVQDGADYQSFWINGYNLLVIQGIVQNYPVKSPLDVSGFFDKTKRSIGGTQISLNDIENKLLRAKFPGEARFHFVLVCAGLGCPPIINEAYLPSALDAQLERQTNKAINDPEFIRVNKNKVKVSQIFEWYKGDFTQNGKSVVDYINLYRTEKLPENSKVSYYTYDWTLNEKN